jgi:CelD/BcsL family acetyltransferase involved in cellulose biosynthesis
MTAASVTLPATPRRANALEATCIAERTQLRRLADDWRNLWDRSATSNPFLHPDWMIPWALHHVPDGELRVVTARLGGRLVGVVPMWRARLGPPGLGAHALRQAGTGAGTYLTEAPGVLSSPGEHRRVLRSAVAHMVGRHDRWDWIELSLSPEQGWFEPEWTCGPEGRSGLVLQRGSRAFVVVDLSEEAGARKQNLKESIRKARVRLSRLPGSWEVELARSPADVSAAVTRVVDLHRRRAGMGGRLPHADLFGADRDREFAQLAFESMAAPGLAEIWLLNVNRRAVAGIATLRAAGTTFLSFSGVDPDVWDLNANTFLQAQIIERARERGDQTVNLSTGASVAKLRWSEQLEIHHDFVAVRPDNVPVAKLAAWWGLRSVASVLRERRRFTGRPG